MEYRITIARPAGEVFAFLASPANILHWLPQLRRDAAGLPDGGLEADRETSRILWHFEPAGSWHIGAAAGVAELVLSLSHPGAPAPDPTEREAGQDRIAHAAQAALQSIKSHVEGAAGGDPALKMPDIPSRLYGHTATQEPEV